MNTLWQDISYGARILLKSPGFTFAALLALALGIGANTAIFSVVNAILLRPLPFKDPDRVVMLWETETKRGGTPNGFSYPRFTFLRDRAQSFDGVCAYTTQSFNLTGQNEPERFEGASISADFFRVTGVAPALGRAFTPEEDQPGGSAVVILSHDLWQRRFGANPGLIGQSITLNDRSHTVVGIMPSGFKLLDDQVDLWVPRVFETSEMSPEQIQRGAIYLAVVGRLKRNVELRQAQADLEVINGQYQQAYAGNADAVNGQGLGSLRDMLVKDFRPTLLLLLGAVGLVLLIACVNVANLLLSRSMARHKEIAIRMTLGATRWRLMRQTLTESVLLSLTGGALGLLLAFLALKSFTALGPQDILDAGDIRIDLWVLTFALLVSTLTGLLFGVVPALVLAKSNPNESLKEGGRSGSGGTHRHRLRSALVISEVALSLVLLISAGLLIRGFMRLRNVDTGLNPHQILTMQISLPSSRYAEPVQQINFIDQVLQRVGSLPGVRSAGVTSTLHLAQAGGNSLFYTDGQSDLGPGNPSAKIRIISAQYLQTLGIRLVRGRMFTDRDNASGPRVMLINESMARRYFPNQDPLGRKITYSLRKVTCEIVGVISDAKTSILHNQAQEEIYVPYTQRPIAWMTLVVGSIAADPLSLSEAVRREVHAVDRDQPVAKIRTMEQIVAESEAQPRFTAILLGIFAVVAVVLAAIGIYGITAYSVTQRTHEFGILMAVGAQQRDVLKLVLVQGLILALIGMGVGLLATFPLTRVLQGLLYGVSPTDPLTFVLVSLLLTIVCLLACYIPAVRATRVDPLIALRHQ